MCYSLWYNAPTMLPVGSLEAEELTFLRFQVTGRQHCRCIIPQAVTQSSAPEEGQNKCPKHVELTGIAMGRQHRGCIIPQAVNTD